MSTGQTIARLEHLHPGRELYGTGGAFPSVEVLRVSPEGVWLQWRYCEGRWPREYLIDWRNVAEWKWCIDPFPAVPAAG